MIDEKLIKEAEILVKVVKSLDKEADKNLPEDIAKIVKFHSKGAAAAAIAGGIIPGFGSAIAVTTSAGFIWTMYGKINKKINVPIAQNILKSLASGIATNLVSYALAGVILSSPYNIIL